MAVIDDMRDLTPQRMVIERIVKLNGPHFVILVAPEFLRCVPMSTKTDAKLMVIERIVKLSYGSRRRLVHRRQTYTAGAWTSRGLQLI